MNINKDKIEIIVDVISKYFEMKKTQIFKRDRRVDYVQARHLCFYFSKKKTPLSLNKIAEYLGAYGDVYNHATVLSGVNKMKYYISAEKDLKMISDDISMRIDKRIEEKKEVWLSEEKALEKLKKEFEQNTFGIVKKKLISSIEKSKSFKEMFNALEVAF